MALVKIDTAKQVSVKVLKDFAIANSWQRQMNESRGLDSFNNYSGENLGDLVVVIGQNRDSELMEVCNFQEALNMLGGESKHVTVERFGHWGCGWFELILVNPKSRKHLKIAYEIKKSLDEYPLLDEAEYSERQTEAHFEYADSVKEDLAKALSMHFGVKNGPELELIALDLNMECQQYFGDDACINIYTCRKPDKSDIKELLTCIDQLDIRSYTRRGSYTFQALLKAIKGME
jgi:hypothetical protein